MANPLQPFVLAGFWPIWLACLLHLIECVKEISNLTLPPGGNDGHHEIHAPPTGFFFVGGHGPNLEPVRKNIRRPGIWGRPERALESCSVGVGE